MSDVKNSFTFHFHAPVGQQIAHVDKIEAHFDKDMGMHIEKAEQVQATQTEQSHTQSKCADYCTYIVPEPKRSRDEIESDIERTSHDTASVFAKCLLRLYKNGELDFGKDTVKTIFAYLKQRYNLSYGYANFSAVFTLPMK